MSKNKKVKSNKAKQAASVNESKRKFILLPIAAVAIGGTALGLNALETDKRELHDLSVIGQGAPVIVQIHDPQCPTCRRLKKIVSNEINPGDNVQFRLADITVPEGKAMQDKYRVTHSTLLFFDKNGKHVHSTQGLQTKDQIRTALGTIIDSQS